MERGPLGSGGMERMCKEKGCMVKCKAGKCMETGSMESGVYE